MKWTKMLVSIFCLSCLLTTGYIAEGSSQVSITVPNLLTELPYNWRPEDGATLHFNVKVTKPPYYSGRLTATLSEVTNYPGACGNRDSFYNDLELRQDSFHNSGWRVETEKVELSHTIENNVSATNTERIPLRVDCADYAAYGILTFTVTGSSSSITIKIPRDTNGNKIADCWKNDETTADPNNNNPSKNYVASWDEESGPPNNSQRGDNLTVLDEYRGLYVNGEWIDTDPEKWDVFIRSESGLGYATKLPGMTLHLMGLGEVSHDLGHVLYYQASSSFPGRVYAIRLKNDNVEYDPGNPQKALGHMGLGPPSSGTKGLIYPKIIEVKIDEDQTKSGAIAYVVAHEIGHGVHLHHCSNHIDLDCYMWEDFDAVAQHVTQFHSHHERDYDLKYPSSAPQTPLPIPDEHRRSYDTDEETWAFLALNELHPITVGSSTSGQINNQNQNTTNNQTIVSTNLGSSSYGCGYNAEYDYCTDTGTCTTRSGQFENGLCGHRWCCCAPLTTTPTLTSANGSYTATAGGSHTANVSVPSGWTQIYWYLKSPSKSGYGTSQSVVSDSTGNSTSASFTYSFPSGVSGDYVLTAYVYSSDGTIVEPSYTVTVSLPSSTDTTTSTDTPLSTPATTPSGTLDAWGSYSLVVSSPYTPPILQLTTTVPFTSVSWYVLAPGHSNESAPDTNTFRPPTSDTTYYPSLGAGDGDYKVRAEVTPSSGSSFSVSCTITVSSDQ